MAKLPKIHPGEVLREEFLEPLGLSGYRLAKDIGVPVTRVHAIVHEERGISADTAKRLARYFRTTPEFWLNLQNGYDLADDAAQEEIDQIEPCPDIEVAVRSS